jgi:PAS domain S-box-containing protein
MRVDQNRTTELGNGDGNRAADALRSADEARRISEFRFERLVEQSPQSTQLFAPDGTCTRVNAAWERLWGITLADVPGYNILHDPQLAERGVRPLFERAFAGEGAATIDPIPYVLNHGRDAGTTKWVGAYIYPVKDDAGRVVEVVLVHNDVTPQTLARDALARSERRLQTLFDNASEAIFVADDAARYVDVNPAACALTGYTREELLRMSVWDLAAESARHVGDDMWREFVSAGRMGGQYPLTRKDGGVVVTEFRAVANVLPGQHLSILRDVTDRTRGEQSLREREERLQALTHRLQFLDHLSQEIRDTADPEQVMAIVTRALGTHLATSRCAYADVAPDGDRFVIRDYCAPGVATSAGEYRLDLFGPRAAADQRAGRTLVIRDVDAELSAAAAGDAGAATFSAIGIKAIICCPLVKQDRLLAMMAVHGDRPRNWTPEEIVLVQAVVDRSWAYIERARAARALAESEHAFRQLADAMPQIVFAARPDGHVDYFNRQWYEYTGLPEGVDTGIEHWRHVHTEEGLGRVAEVWGESLRTGAPYEIEYKLRRRDGTYRWHLGRALPVRDAEGRIVRWFGTNTDIHDQKELQEEKESLLQSERAARQEAERAGRMKDEFLATLSHELRTPLNAILGWAQILRTGHADAEDLAQGLETIERNARAQTQIIEDLLDMSRIISGKVRLDVRRLDLAPLVQGAIDTVRPAADAKGVRLHVATVGPSCPAVSGDAGRLQQVFWNLLSNAVKFTPRGGRVDVTLRCEDNGEGGGGSDARVTIADTGEGIDPSFLPYVFDRFRQADASTSRQHGGLGLGLSIVRHLVELHGGTVHAASDGQGRGSSFVVTLPLFPPTASVDGENGKGVGGSSGVATPVSPGLGVGGNGDGVATAAASDAPVSLPGSVTLHGVRALVVDDEPDSRELVRRLLADCGAEVVTAGSANDALRVARETRPTVLITDVGMPGEDGYSLIRRIRSLPHADGGNVPAIALTAYARVEDRTRAMLAGFQMHLSKPVESAELIVTVASLVGRTGLNGA